MPIVGETGWRAMVVVADVQRGQRVLIEGGAGGVGSSAVQIAKARGAYVIAMTSPAHNALLRSLGADELIDYHDALAEDAIAKVDVVLNTVDADTGARALGMIKPGGLLVSVVGAPPRRPVAAAQIRCAITGPVTGEFLGALSSSGRSRAVQRQHSAAPAARGSGKILGPEPRGAHGWQDHS